ncbi:hypothetical protein BKA60DRAFT_657985 [Fusarium oxysporum]|nr:hypothetical protein BKA60DRAFT_657985 [Fusarium oxysporum]
MSSHPIQSALDRDEGCISPATNLQPDSPEYLRVEAMMQGIMQFICQEFRSMNSRISELQIEVRENSGSKSMSALERINKRLSHFDDINARFNETGMLDYVNIKALDVFNGRLLNIEEDIKFVKHSIRGTAEDLDDSVKCYLGKIDQRLGALEGNLHRLEDRMFANLDGAIDDETGFITLVMDPLDYGKLETMNPTEIAEKLREKGSGWKIESVKLKPPKTAHQPHQVIINFLTRKSKAYMRQHISEMSELFGLEHGVFCLSPTYTLHVEHLVPHLANKDRGHRDLEEALLQTLGVKDIKAKVTYDRMLLKTQSFDIVTRLCLTSVTLLGHYYQIVPFCVQGTPLFCFKCWKASHFKEDCTASVMLCGRCSGNHDTRGCKAPSRCCNCKGPHTTWSPECRDILSMKEHRNSAWYRQLSPHWAKNLPMTGKPIVPTVTKAKMAKPSPAASSPTVSGEQNDSRCAQSAEKKPVGRPKSLPVKEPGQQTIAQFYKAAGSGLTPAPSKEPSSSADAEMTGTDTASLQLSEGTGVASSSTPSSTAGASRSSVSGVDSALAAMEIDIDIVSSSALSESNSSGSGFDSSAISVDIDTAGTAGNDPIEGQTPQFKSPKPSNNTQTKDDPKVGKQGSYKNKNNKNKSATKKKRTQLPNAPSNAPSLDSSSPQTQNGDKPGGANGRKKGKMTYKEYQAWKKARAQSQAQAATSIPQDNTDSPATNTSPAPASGASDIPPPPVPPSNTPLDPAHSSVPTLSARATSVPTTPASAPIPPSPTPSTPSNSAPPAKNPSTTSAPSVPIFASLSTAPAAVPPPLTQPSNFNYKEISQPTSRLGPLSGKRERSPDLPP